MNLVDKPELLSRLAAAYAVGTLRGGARRRFESMARVQAPVRAQALIWQARIGGIVELQPDLVPPQAVWTRIENLIQADLEQGRMAAQRAAPVRAGGARGGWRWATAFSLSAAILTGLLGWRALQDRDEQLAALAGERDKAQQGLVTAATEVTRLKQELTNQPRVEYVAVLGDDRSGANVLVTFDPQARRLTLQRVGEYREASDKSLQLWAVAPGATPRSLGVLDSASVMRIAAESNALTAAPLLAISLEPKGGVSGEKGPTGPVLFKGALLKTAL